MQPLTQAVSAGVLLRLGLITLTVSVHSAVGEEESLRMVCTKDHALAAVSQKYVCPTCEYSSSNPMNFARATKSGAGLVEVPAQVLTEAGERAAAHKKVIDISVHPAGEVSSKLLPSGKSYYLSLKDATEATRAVYTIIARTVQDNPDVALMAKFTLRSATGIFRLTTAGEGTLVLQQMSDPAMVRVHPVIEFVEPPAHQLAMARELVALECSPFVEEEHETGKSNIIAAYVGSQAPAPVIALTAAPEATDLTEALKAMLDGATKKKTKKKASAETPGSARKES